MNATVQSQLTRLESALDALVDSITTYNPSPSAATQLLAADAALTADLGTLSTHQRNAHALHALRATSATLDARIKATLAMLADTRTELLARAPPEPLPPHGANPADDEPAAAGVDYALLLNTAQRIAPFTRPRVRSSAPPQAAGSGGDAAPASTAAQTTQLSGVSMDESAEQSQVGELGRAAPAVLDEQQQAFLDPGSAEAAQFTPWPDALAMWSGSLARTHQGGSGMNGAGDAGEKAVAKEEEEGETEVEAVEPKQVNGELGAADPRPERAPPVLTGEEVERRRAEAEARRRQQEEELGEFDLYDPDAE